MNIKSKVYYEVATGNVLVVTNEAEIAEQIAISTKEQDIKRYSQLKGKSLAEIDYIELEYGTLRNVFINAKSYKVNLETKALDIVYYSGEELKAAEAFLKKIQEGSI